MVRDTNATSEVRNYFVSNDSEVASIPVAAVGSYIYVVNGGATYMSDGTTWVKQ